MPSGRQRTSTDEAPGDESDLEDEIKKPGFINASQYDPEPTPKMKRKAAEEQKEKLAALKKWTHIDAFKVESFRGVQDNILYNMLWEDYDTCEQKASRSVAGAIPTEGLFPAATGKQGMFAALEETDLAALQDLSSASSVRARRTKARSQNGVADDLSASSVEGFSAGEDSKNPSDDEPVTVPVKRKFKADRITSPSRGSDPLAEPALGSVSVKAAQHGRTRSTRVAGEAGVAIHADTIKKHDLRDLVAKGQGGRVMFVFEKISKSKMTIEEDKNHSGSES